MRAVADTHALVWYLKGSQKLSDAAATTLTEAQATEGLVVPAAVLFDLWYVTQTTRAFGASEVADIKSTVAQPDNGVELAPIDLPVFNAWETIDRSTLTDPWDRLIVATAISMGLMLVTRDEPIKESGLVPTIW